jgi:protein FAM32A
MNSFIKDLKLWLISTSGRLAKTVLIGASERRVSAIHLHRPPYHHNSGPAPHPPTATAMPTDDYTPIVRGGLKLKGSSATPSGIKKKKKNKKPKPVDEESLSRAVTENEESGSSGTLLQTTKSRKDDGSDGEEDNLDLRELEQRGEHDGKTATERAYEETRRKRVSSLPNAQFSLIAPSTPYLPKQKAGILT